MRERKRGCIMVFPYEFIIYISSFWGKYINVVLSRKKVFKNSSKFLKIHLFYHI